MAVTLPMSVRNAQAQVIVNAIHDGGGETLPTGAPCLIIYDGVRPTDPSVPVSAQTVCAILNFPSLTPCTLNPGEDTITFEAPDDETSATGSDVNGATWARIWTDYDGNGIGIIDLSVGSVGSGADIELNSTSISTGATVSITGLTYQIPN